MHRSIEHVAHRSHFLRANPVLQTRHVLSQRLRLSQMKPIASFQIQTNVVVDCVEARLDDRVPWRS